MGIGVSECRGMPNLDSLFEQERLTIRVCRQDPAVCLNPWRIPG
jgi:hypothetical protein